MPPPSAYFAALLLIACAAAHPSHVALEEGVDCAKDMPAFQSYHIHVLFWGNSPAHAAGAMDLQHKFMAEFGLLGEKNCTGFLDQGRLCAFGVNWAPGGPFTTAEYSFYIPVEEYARTVPWMMQHRGQYDVLVHPNSGCMANDHLEWPLWGGKPWEIDGSIFP